MVASALFSRPTRRAVLGAVASAAALGLARPARAAPDKVRFGTNWVAQAEHGGFYQALADGTYARHGLDVAIVPGGPQSNNRLLLTAGRLDFYMGGNMIQPLAAVEQDIPTLVVAAIFQRDPQALLAHPGRGIGRLADLRDATLYLSKQTVASTFKWLKAEFGFRDEQVKPYTFSAAPFLRDPGSAQQGYVTSDPFAISREGGFEPVVLLLADEGWDSYSTTIETHRDLARGRPDVVRRFVAASAQGWRTYLNGDNAAANALIRAANPDMTEDRIAAAIEAMRARGLVESGDALAGGIGTMTDARMASFYDRMVRAGVLPPGLDIRRAYSLAFLPPARG